MRTVTIGMDLGDKNHIVSILDEKGKNIKRCFVRNTKKDIQQFFNRYQGATVAIEAGTHSPWVSRELERLGCHVLVGNPRKLRAIWNSDNKTDDRDSDMLARIARFDPQLLTL